MCVICVSGKGVPQPSKKTITNMYTHNYHGAGFMFCRDGEVQIQKGFDSLADYFDALDEHKFSASDVVIYHFRIATQAGRLEMTQPFPLSEDEFKLQKWSCSAPFGVAHNGIIRATSNGNPLLSDTALYIRDYLAPRITKEKDIPALLDTIEQETIGSRLALSDVGVAATMLQTAVKGAAMNVYINTKLMKDRSYAEELNTKTMETVREVDGKCAAVYEGVRSSLTGGDTK